MSAGHRQRINSKSWLNATAVGMVLDLALIVSVAAFFGSIALTLTAFYVPVEAAIAASTVALIATPFAIARLVQVKASRGRLNTMITALATISSVPAGAIVLYLFSLLLPLSWWESDAIGRAEAFVLRNGYTAAGHPPDLPVLVNDIMDNVSSADDLVEMRRGMLESRAIGIVGVKGFGYDVLFRYSRPELDGLNDLHDYFVVSVGADGEAHTKHMMPRYPEWVYKANPR